MDELTDAEHYAVDLAGRLYTLIADEIVGSGSTREDDLRELRAYVHGIQRMVLAQAAARTHPGRYRLLGESLTYQTFRRDRWGNVIRRLADYFRSRRVPSPASATTRRSSA